jgi:hypothetical protein
MALTRLHPKFLSFNLCKTASPIPPVSSELQPLIFLGFIVSSIAKGHRVDAVSVGVEGIVLLYKCQSETLPACMHGPIHTHGHLPTSRPFAQQKYTISTCDKRTKGTKHPWGIEMNAKSHPTSSRLSKPKRLAKLLEALPPPKINSCVRYRPPGLRLHRSHHGHSSSFANVHSSHLPLQQLVASFVSSGRYIS